MRKSNARLTIEFVREQFEKGGCTLLSTEYVNARTNLKYICSCGTESQIRYDNFRQGKRCSDCRYRTIAEKKRHSLEYVQNFYLERGCTLLETEYVNTKTKMRYICECGQEAEMNFSNFQSGQRCWGCRLGKISGENSPHYKPHLTDEHRLIGRNDVKLREWRKEIFERDDYTCYKCEIRGGELNAHHLNAYNVFPELRYVASNGVTLCKSCHMDFHKDYGFGYNTVEQFADWLGEAVADDFVF